jgi:hypothetical protein
VKILLEEFKNLARDMSITHEISVSGKGGRFNVLKETLQITAKNLQLSIDTAKSVTSLEIDITKEFNDVVESMKEFETESREKSSEERGKSEDAELSQPSILKLSIALSDIIDYYCKSLLPMPKNLNSNVNN